MKGFYSQGIAVLLSEPVAVEDLEPPLQAFGIAKRNDASEEWALGGPSLLLPYRPDVNGFVLVDTIDRPWPDPMGDPQSEAMLFGAWSMGHFGPFTFPGGLERAGQHSWLWEEGREMPARHRAFLRVRSSYIFGGDPEKKVVPPDYDPVEELLFVTRVARALLDLPRALCLFNPNGECLHPAAEVDRLLKRKEEQDLLPLELWANVRFFKTGENRHMMDTVGMWQLDVPDHEADFDSRRFEPNDMAAFLRNASLYVLEKGPIIKDGDTMDGPGDIRWQAYSHQEGFVQPPRDVLRWAPEGEVATPSGGSEIRKPWWKLW